MITPPLWTTLRPKFLPWPLESYINGVHIFSSPQPWLFPLFPWSAFAFVGLAVGFFLYTDSAKNSGTNAFTFLGLGGIAVCGISQLFDESPIRLYAVYDYWHTGPNFFLMRCGLLLFILFFAYIGAVWVLQREVSARSSSSAKHRCSSTGCISNSSMEASRFSQGTNAALQKPLSASSLFFSQCSRSLFSEPTGRNCKRTTLPPNL